MRNVFFVVVLAVMALSLGCAKKVQRYGMVIGVKKDMLDKWNAP